MELQFELRMLEDDQPITLEKLRDGKILVLDLWTTRCERCPAALDKLNEMAKTYKENGQIVFASVNADDRDFAMEIVEENDWEDLTHCFIDLKNKDLVKEKLGLKSVPFYIVIDKNGQLWKAGGGKDVDFSKLPELFGQGGNKNDNNNNNNSGSKAIAFDEDF